MTNEQIEKFKIIINQEIKCAKGSNFQIEGMYNKFKGMSNAIKVLDGQVSSEGFDELVKIALSNV